MRWAASATRSVWGEDQANIVHIPWEKLARVIKPKGGNCAVIIAAPGQGKTTVMLNWVAQSGVKALYISSDTSPHDITSQIGAIASGHERSKVEGRLASDESWREQYSKDIYKAYPNIVFDFSSSPTMESIKHKAYALTELWGTPPEMIVMDTASNVAMADMGSNAEWQRVWLTAISVARELNTFFVFAHHVKQGPARGGRVAPEMSDGLWGCDQFPEFVLGIHSQTPGELVLTVRKNRGGPKDVPIKLAANFAFASVKEMTK